MGSWEDSIFYGGRLSYFIIRDDMNILSGRCDFKQPQNYRQKIPFSSPFTKPPYVVVWLTGLDMESGKNLRIKAEAYDITDKEFTLEVGTWADSILFGGRVEWMAIADDQPNIVCGKLDSGFFGGTTNGTAGVVTLRQPGRKLKRVLVAFNYLDCQKGANLRMAVDASVIDDKVLRHAFASWSDSRFYQAKADYIALYED
ncbi:hypothetical protein MMC14_009713 [Varicellaria rhodocarpa]|nr:hypothetical protein [Varicellaria rhodocarpa]